jgi:hypothetical protein
MTISPEEAGIIQEWMKKKGVSPTSKVCEKGIMRLDHRMLVFHTPDKDGMYILFFVLICENCQNSLFFPGDLIISGEEPKL